MPGSGSDRSSTRSRRGFILQANHVSVSSRRRRSCRRQQAARAAKLAAQADHHHLAPKLGLRQVVRSVRIGMIGVRRVDGHATAVAVLQRHHAIHVGVPRQQFGRMRFTAEGGRRPRIAVVVMAEIPCRPCRRRCGSPEGVASSGGRRRRRRWPWGSLPAFAPAAKGAAPFVHPAAGGQVARGLADDDVVASTRRCLGRSHRLSLWPGGAPCRATQATALRPRCQPRARRWRRRRRCRRMHADQRGR